MTTAGVLSKYQWNGIGLFSNTDVLPETTLPGDTVNTGVNITI